MSDQPDPTPIVPLQAAQRIHATCTRFESAWRGPTRPELGAFLAEVLEPERSWLLAELLALEVELRQGAGERPTEAEYRLSFPSAVEREIIAVAFRHCADCQEQADPSPHPADAATKAAQAFAPSGIRNAANVRPEDRHPHSSSTTPSRPTIEGYEILDTLGRGGMGVVYKARDVRLKRLVALKMILAGTDAGTEHLARFRSEAEMVARLQHPNIVQIFDVGNQHDDPYIAFEFIEGQTLAEFAGREPQPARLAAELLEAMAHAMQYAHQHGIVHRDLKPSNVLLAEGGSSSSSGSARGSNITHPSSSAFGSGTSGQHATVTGLVPKITDFGLAKDLEAVLECTTSGAILGTPNYMSPEQAESRRDIGPASDIYSLGAILYVLLTGRPPFQGTSAIETLKMVVNNEPVAPTELQPRLAKDLGTICLKCLHKDPAKRYETAGDLADDLRRFLNDEPILARPSGRVEKTWRWCRRNPSIAALLASILFVLVSGIVVSGYFGLTANLEAQAARKAEQFARHREIAEASARKDADAQRERAESAVAESLLDQGLGYCENHDVSRGLLTMVRALEKAPPSATEVTEAIRLNLAFWQGQVGVRKARLGRYGSSITAVAFAPDGKTFLRGDWGNHKNVLGPAHLVVHDGLTGMPKSDARKDHAQAIWRIAYAPSGNRFATASLDGSARLWDAATCQPVGQPMLHEGRRVFSLAFSPDGKRLLTGSNGRSESSVLQVWNAESGAPDGAPLTQPGLVRTVAWSGDGKLWASGSVESEARTQESRGGEIRFWDAQTRQPFGEPLRQTDGVWAVAFQPRVGLLASGTDDGLVRFWNPATGGQTGKLLQLRDRVTSLMFSRDGQLLLTGSGENRPDRVQGGEARLWNVNTGQLTVQPLVPGFKVNDVALSPDQRTVVTAGDDGAMHLWQVGASITVDFIFRQAGLTRTFLTPDGKTLITLSKNARRQSIAQHWEARTGRALGKPLVLPDVVGMSDVEKQAKFIRPYTQIVGRPDGRWAASAEFADWPFVGSTTPWLFWDTVTHEPLEVPYDVRHSYGLAFSRDSKLLAVARHVSNGDSECRVWDIERWQPLFEPIVIKSPVLSLLFAANGRSLLTGSQDGIVRRLSVPGGELLSESENLGSEVRGLRLSPDGTQVVLTGSNNVNKSPIQLWSEVDLSPLAPINILANNDLFTNIQFVPGGKFYLSYNPVRLWDAASGQPRRRLDGHQVYANLYAAHSSGAYVALVITPQQVRLWHPNTGKWVGRTMSFPVPINDLAISPDGAALFVSCRDGSVCRLSLPAALEGSVPQVKSDFEALTRQGLAEDGSLVEKTSSR